MTQSIEEKLRSLGVPEEEVLFDVGILTASTDLETLRIEKRAKKWGAGQYRPVSNTPFQAIIRAKS